MRRGASLSVTFSTATARTTPTTKISTLVNTNFLDNKFKLKNLIWAFRIRENEVTVCCRFLHRHRRWCCIWHCNDSIQSIQICRIQEYLARRNRSRGLHTNLLFPYLLPKIIQKKQFICVWIEIVERCDVAKKCNISHRMKLTFGQLNELPQSS